MIVRARAPSHWWPGLYRILIHTSDVLSEHSEVLKVGNILGYLQILQNFMH